MNCTLRKILPALNGETRTNAQETASTITSARMNPVKGETTIAATVLPRPFHTITCQPALQTPAPTNPPIKAWLEDEGMPTSQVTMFQMMALRSAARIPASLTIAGVIMPVPMVLATCEPNTAKAIKLKKAAQATA